MEKLAVRIANGAGFLGDNLDASRRLVERAEVEYLTLEYLAELTMSILARSRQRDPAAGYAKDFLAVLASLTPALLAQPRLKIVTNAGGVNPTACAHEAARILSRAGLDETSLAVVDGDDLLPRLAELQAAGCALAHMDTGEPLSTLKAPVVSANAYLGAIGIAKALDEGARIVITGRVADASLTVGPAVHEFAWQWTDYDRLAGASVAGHLIECGAQVTGGLYRDWQDLNLADVGYPIAELDDTGNAVITKPPRTGGVVNRHTVAEQLIYEIGDPRHYLTPDVDVDFTTVRLMESGADRVRVEGASGRPPPSTYKVSLAYADGYMASGQLLVLGRDCVEKAQACGRMIFERVATAGYKLEATNSECLGAGAGMPGLATAGPHRAPYEVVLRVTARDSRREAIERFTAELAPLITSGPPGIGGYATGRPSVRSVYAYWPTLIPRNLVTPRVDTRAVQNWLLPG